MSFAPRKIRFVRGANNDYATLPVHGLSKKIHAENLPPSLASLQLAVLLLVLLAAVLACATVLEAERGARLPNGTSTAVRGLSGFWPSWASTFWRPRWSDSPGEDTRQDSS